MLKNVPMALYRSLWQQRLTQARRGDQVRTWPDPQPGLQHAIGAAGQQHAGHAGAAPGRRPARGCRRVSQTNTTRKTTRGLGDCMEYSLNPLILIK